MGFLRRQMLGLGRAVKKMFGFGFDLLGSFALSHGRGGALGRAIYDKAWWLRAYDEALIVQVPVRRIEEDFAKPVWMLKLVEYQMDAPPIFRRVYQHPFLALLKHPHPEFTGIAFKQMMIRHWLLCGEVIVFIEERNRLGEPSKIFLIEPYKMSETPIDNAEGVYRFTVGKGVSQKIITAPATEVVYICNPSAFACHGRGVGRVTALSREVKLDEKSSDWSLAVYDNGSVVGAIVHMPDVEADDLEKLQKEWDSKYTGIDNVGKTLFLSSDSIDGKSPMSVEKIGTAHKELDYTDSKKDLLKRALILFGIPAQVVGDIAGGSRSDTGGADYIHQSKNIEPLLSRFTEEFELRLLSQFRGTENMVVTYESPVREEAAFRHQRLIEGAKNGLAHTNEWRAEAELEPLTGKLGTALSLPLNMIHCDQDGNVLIAPDHQAPAIRQEDDADNAASSVALNAANQALALLKGITSVH